MAPGVSTGHTNRYQIPELCFQIPAGSDFWSSIPCLTCTIKHEVSQKKDTHTSNAAKKISFLKHYFPTTTGCVPTKQGKNAWKRSHWIDEAVIQ